MATTTLSLAVTTRAKAGTAASHALRRTGKVPGVLFGHGSAPAPIEIDAKALDDVLHAGGKTHLLDLTIDGGTRDTALIREVQRHPITRRVLHADFQRVGATEEITTSLPLVAVGVAEGVKNAGGVMDVVLHVVDVTGPANALPEQLEAVVDGLGVHEHLTAGDLKLPAGIRLATPPETILISIAPSKTEAEAAEATPAPAAADVPVIDESAPAPEA